ncbi:MAG TPA: HEAT repeat domain-containing protein [Thermoanaerobaculia bacterium]|nr:HEAT repeat domain-containing protein [Thermoanaerobaculia bacterium]
MRPLMMVVLILVVACNPAEQSGPAPATAPPADTSGTSVAGKTERMSVEDFVRQRHAHGVPYEEAKAYGPDAVPTLIGMLQNPANEEHLPNIVATLGAIGDPRATEALIEFVEKTEGEVSIHRFDALLAVSAALGQIAGERPAAAKSENAALAYLLDHSSPSRWGAEQLRWSYGRYRGERLHDLLTEVATNGLGISGSDEAYVRLQAMRDKPESARVRMLLQDEITEALATNRAVRSRG